MSVRRVFGLAALLVTVAGCTESVTSVSPTSVVAGNSQFELTVLGAGFTSSNNVQWNGSSRTTTFVSATELIAQINAADVATAGTASVTVSGGDSGLFGGSSTSSTSSTSTTTTSTTSSTSNTETVSIVAPTGDANAYEIDPAHDSTMTLPTGTVSFTSPTSWHVSIGAGAPSNVVIADGSLFLTTGTSGGSQLLALSQSNGATVWGPVAIPGTAGGSAGVAYDDNEVFVTQDQSGIGGGSTLYAYNSSSGTLNWSTALGAASPGPPTAGDGYVYVIAAGSGTLYAVNETSGAIAWQQSLSTAAGAAAVTADGVYVAATTSGCYAIDFRPATGEIIWNTSSGTLYCPSSATPTVSNGLVYGPNTSGTEVFDSEAGTDDGLLSYSLPAAVTSSDAYFFASPNLDAVNLTSTPSSDSVQWTFNGDNEINTSPIVITDSNNDEYVVAGSSDGHIYAVGVTSGSSEWSQSLGNSVTQIAAGDGLLIAITETTNYTSGTLTAFSLTSSSQ